MRAGHAPILPPKRRLTVLQPHDDPDALPRPGWQWIVFGAVAILTAWLPVAYAEQALAARLLAAAFQKVGVREPFAPDIAALPIEEQEKMSLILWVLPAATLALAAAAGGFLIGRWSDRAGVRHAAAAGALATLLPIALAWVGSGASWGPLASVAVAAPAAALGAYVGRRGRPPRIP